MKQIDTMKEAKSLIVSIFGNHCTYEIMKHIGHAYEDINYEEADCRICGGSFREVFIPNNLPFVIKTGINKYGTRQCARESDIYNAAVKQGFEKRFAKCYGSFRWHGHYFYVFEKIKDIGDFDGNFFDYVKNVDLEWFCCHNGVNDLHTANFGRRGRMYVICDYAGYDWRNEQIEEW